MQRLANRDRKDFFQKMGRQWAVLFLVAELLFFILMAKGFLSLNTFQIILFYGTAVFLMGTAELYIIVTGGIDLSVGYVMGLASIISAKLIVLFTHMGMSSTLAIILGIILTLGFGLIPGLINGLLISRLNVPPLYCNFFNARDSAWCLRTSNS